MRLKIVLLSAFAAFLVASASKTPALVSDDVPAAAVAPAPSSPSTTLNAGLQSANPQADWYADPIAIALALVALFVVIDLTIMVVQRAHHRGAHVLR